MTEAVKAERQNGENMGHIYYIMGKSASGKDSVFRVLAADPELRLRTVVMYTTRPMREGEQDGREYFFRNEEFLAAKQAEGTVIESRTYETVCGLWSYFTLDDGQIDLENHRYLMIGTPESYLATKKYFERQKKTPLSPLYIHVEDGERLIPDGNLDILEFLLMAAIDGISDF